MPPPPHLADLNLSTIIRTHHAGPHLDHDQFTHDHILYLVVDKLLDMCLLLPYHLGRQVTAMQSHHEQTAPGPVLSEST